jgi:hypothetical protein
LIRADLWPRAKIGQGFFKQAVVIQPEKTAHHLLEFPLRHLPGLNGGQCRAPLGHLAQGPDERASVQSGALAETHRGHRRSPLSRPRRNRGSTRCRTSASAAGILVIFLLIHSYYWILRSRSQISNTDPYRAFVEGILSSRMTTGLSN